LAGYHFVTTWRLDAGPPAVWSVVDDVEHWPQWWPGVCDARLLPEGPAGRRVALTFRAVLGYSLSFEADVVRTEPPHLGEARVSGDLDGTGRWELREDAGGTILTWTWQVEPRVRWLRLLSRPARPVFAWAHADLMRRGRAGLAARLSGSPPSRPRR
jgi:hypothetical protein